MIEKGDSVKIVNPGRIYPSYQVMAETLESKKFVFEKYPDPGDDIGIVLDLGMHEDERNGMIALVALKSGEFLYAVSGLEKIDKIDVKKETIIPSVPLKIKKSVIKKTQILFIATLDFQSKEYFPIYSMEEYTDLILRMVKEKNKAIRIYKIKKIR